MELFKSFLTDIFYSFAIFAVYYEYKAVMYPSRLLAYAQKIQRKKIEEFNSHEQLYVVMDAMYKAWCVVGIFSSQCAGFLAILLLSFIPWKKKVKGLVWDGLITLVLLGFIIVNKTFFHFNIKILIFN